MVETFIVSFTEIKSTAGRKLELVTIAHWKMKRMLRLHRVIVSLIISGVLGMSLGLDEANLEVVVDTNTIPNQGSGSGKSKRWHDTILDDISAHQLLPHLRSRIHLSIARDKTNTQHNLQSGNVDHISYLMHDNSYVDKIRLYATAIDPHRQKRLKESIEDLVKENESLRLTSDFPSVQPVASPMTLMPFWANKKYDKTTVKTTNSTRKKDAGFLMTSISPSSNDDSSSIPSFSPKWNDHDDDNNDTNQVDLETETHSRTPLPNLQHSSPPSDSSPSWFPSILSVETLAGSSTHPTQTTSEISSSSPTITFTSTQSLLSSSPSQWPIDKTNFTDLDNNLSPSPNPSTQRDSSIAPTATTSSIPTTRTTKTSMPVRTPDTNILLSNAPTGFQLSETNSPVTIKSAMDNPTPTPVFSYKRNQTKTYYPSYLRQGNENSSSVPSYPFQEESDHSDTCSETLSCYYLEGSCCPTPDGIFLTCCRVGLSSDVTSSTSSPVPQAQTNPTLPTTLDSTDSTYPSIEPTTNPPSSNPSSFQQASTNPITMNTPTVRRSPSIHPTFTTITGSPIVTLKSLSPSPSIVLTQTYIPTTNTPINTPTYSSSVSVETSSPTIFVPSISPSITVSVSRVSYQPFSHTPTQHQTKITTSPTSGISTASPPPSSSKITTAVPSVSFTSITTVDETYEFSVVTLTRSAVIMEFQRATVANNTRRMQEEPSGEKSSNKTENERENKKRCTNLWRSYVERQIQGAIEKAIPYYETLSVQILNISQYKSYKNDTSFFTFLFDVQVEIRSVLTTQQRDITQYIESPFDSVREQDALVDYMRSTITGCNDYEDFVSVRIILIGSDKTNDKDNGTDSIIDRETGSKTSISQIGLIASLSIAALIVLMLSFGFIYYKTQKGHRRHSTGNGAIEHNVNNNNKHQEIFDSSSFSIDNKQNNYVTEIGFRRKNSAGDDPNDLMSSSQDISTLGDPLPQGMTRYYNNGMNGGADDLSTLESTCIEYDYQKAFVTSSARNRSQSNKSVLTGTVTEDTDNDNNDDIKKVVNSNNKSIHHKLKNSQSVKSILDIGGVSNPTTENDEDHDFAFDNNVLGNNPVTIIPNKIPQKLSSHDEEQFEVLAPSGVIGLIVESSTNGTGFPIVHSIKKNSVLAGIVREGDRIVSLDDIDVSNMLAEETSKLIASKKDQPVRRFVFSRPIL